MSNFFDLPILNSPYSIPAKHWELDSNGQPTEKIIEKRRPADFITPIAKPQKQNAQLEMDLRAEEAKNISTEEQKYDSAFINAIRLQVEKSNAEANPELFRIALKMATGAGKTTVMAMLIAWQTINAARYPNSKNFTKCFLVITPGITIKDRLRVLFPNDVDAYYSKRELVPSEMLPDIQKAKIVIANYHNFIFREKIELSAGNRRLLQGRHVTEIETKETPGQMLQRVCPEFLSMKNIMVINDEAHHCYREKTSKCAEKLDEEAKENNEAALCGFPEFYLYGQLKAIVAKWYKDYFKCIGGAKPAQLLYSELANESCNRIFNAITAGNSNSGSIKIMLEPYNSIGSTQYVNFITSKKKRFKTSAEKCHINWAMLDSDWEGEFCRIAESCEKVLRYAKNQGMGFEVPYLSGSAERKYIPDFILLVDDGKGKENPLRLVVEIKGFRGEDAKAKKQTMETFWVPGVNNSGQFGRWAFAEFTSVFEMEKDFGELISKFAEQGA